MLRSLLVALCLLLLKVFFRRIEVVGKDHCPKDGALLFALNHPSGLVDPLFILCLSGRRVSFLAKEPLFRMPLVSLFVKAFECLPVYRSRDGADPEKNRKMMRAAEELLGKGNALALFPEGTSHSDPTLKKFRSGAARIALSARALSQKPVRIVPAALYYENKQTFRSRAVLAFGPAIEVPLVTLDEVGDTPIEAGRALTSRLQEAVEAIMPTTETAEGLVLAEQSERLLSAALRDNPDGCPNTLRFSNTRSGTERTSLADRMELRRKLIDAYLRQIEQRPNAVNGIVARVEEFRRRLEEEGLPIDTPPSHSPSFPNRSPGRILRALVLAPGALLGFAIHAPAYFVIRFIAFRYTADSIDVSATAKVLSGMLLFPLTWSLCCGVAFLWGFSITGLLGVLFGAPVLAWMALEFLSLADALNRRSRLRRDVKSSALDWKRLVEERRALAEDIATLMA